MELSSDAVQVARFMHVICVPFAIRPMAPGDSITLHKVRCWLKDSVWKPLDPGASGPQPELRSLKKPPTHHPAILTDPVWHEFHRLQALAYFHPHVRPLLGDPERVSRWHREDIARLDIELDHWKTGAFRVELAVIRCELWAFQPDIGVLVLEVQSGQSMALNRVQLLLDCLRRLYPPYVEVYRPEEAGANEATRWHGGHCPIRVTWRDRQEQQVGTAGDYQCTHDDGQVALAHFTPYIDDLHRTLQPDQRAFLPLMAHWQSLLDPFVCRNEPKQPGDQRLGAYILGDDRAPIMTWLGFDDVRQVSRGDWIRTCFADPPGGDRLPYADQFASRFEERHCYDRFWYRPTETRDAPSRILNSGYAFAYAGNHADGFFGGEHNGAHATFRHLHVPMGLIAHMQKAQLLNMAHRLSDMARRDQPHQRLSLPAQAEIEDRYLQFIEFTQTAWFDEVTPQEQGQHLFAMWQRELGTAKLYEQVRQSLRDLYDYSELRSDRELNHSVARFGLIALALSILAVVTGLYGMNVPEGNTPSPAAGLPWVFWGVSGMALLCFGAAVKFGWRVFRKPARAPR